MQVNLSSMSDSLTSSALGLDVMRAALVAAIDQYIAAAGFLHFAEGNFLRIGQHGFTVP